MEAEVLKRLSSVSNVPRYITHAICASTVFLFMGKLEACPLDEWLFQTHRRGQCTVEFSTRVVLALVSQMAPTLLVLFGVAFRRDISSKNFSVDEAGGALKFGLLDFGMAVGGDEWCLSLDTCNVDWQHQYADRLDHYAFGILICEVFFELWTGLEEFGMEDFPKWRKKMEAAQTAWEANWKILHGISEESGRIFDQLAESHTGKLQWLSDNLVKRLVALPKRCEGCHASPLLKAAGNLLSLKTTFGRQELQELSTSLMEEPQDDKSSASKSGRGQRRSKKADRAKGEEEDEETAAAAAAQV
eukprot:s2641_g10.t1